ncbi:MAG: hypothetical protein J5U19_12585 [Candidatus Methanoperedens sp.]|nr:hypothetical protein [Candidatus Methanoperedens sp.]
MDRHNQKEIVHLVASLIVLTVAFSYPAVDPGTLAIVAFGVGMGFLLHELAHKFTAQRYGYVADYEASPTGLVLALFLSIFAGFVFAAPGAVMIRGKKAFYGAQQYPDSLQSAREFAYISVSGPVVNLSLGISFLIASLFVPHSGIIYAIFSNGTRINVFLAGFNMIPFGPLDGAKVWRYNPMLWGLIGIPSVILFFIL